MIGPANGKAAFLEVVRKAGLRSPDAKAYASASLNAELQALQRNPASLSRLLCKAGFILEAEGIAVHLEAECIRFEPRGAEIAVGLAGGYQFPRAARASPTPMT